MSSTLTETVSRPIFIDLTGEDDSPPPPVRPTPRGPADEPPAKRQRVNGQTPAAGPRPAVPTTTTTTTTGARTSWVPPPAPRASRPFDLCFDLQVAPVLEAQVAKLDRAKINIARILVSVGCPGMESRHAISRLRSPGTDTLDHSSARRPGEAAPCRSSTTRPTGGSRTSSSSGSLPGRSRRWRGS